MKRWVWSGIVIAAGVIVIACGEQRTAMPSGPMASVTALTNVPACDLSGTNSLVSQYFNDSTGIGDRGEPDVRGPWNEGGDWELVEAPAFSEIRNEFAGSRAGGNGESRKSKK